MYLELSCDDANTLAWALLKAAVFEAENLKYYDHCDKPRENPGINGIREQVADYLNLYRDVMEDYALATGMTEKEGAKEAWDNIRHVADIWNKEIARIKGEGPGVDNLRLSCGLFADNPN